MYDYLAYLIILLAFICILIFAYKKLKNIDSTSACANCSADCKLRGIKRVDKTEKSINCKDSKEKADK